MEQATDSGRRYTLDGAPFYALSLTAVIDGVTEDELLRTPPLKAYPKYYRMRAGDLYAAGYPVWETFRKATHCDVQLPIVTPEAIAAFLAVAGPLHDNHHYEA